MNSNEYTLKFIVVKSKKEIKEIRTNCILSITRKEVSFFYEGCFHKVKYKQTRKGNYFILNKKRYYFKVWDNYENKWFIDCNCW